MLEKIESKKKKNILIYIDGTHRFNLVFNILNNNKDIFFTIYSNNISINEYSRSKLMEFEHVVFTRDTLNILYKLPSFGMFITTCALPASAHSHSLAIISLCKKIKLPTIELQHGLFQYGLHYSSKAEKLKFLPDSLSLKGYADIVLTYYNNDTINSYCIGYPPYSDESDVKSYEGEYNLILSNMHWRAYSEEEKFNFYNILIKFISEKNDELFIWNMHPGELKKTSLNPNMINNLLQIYPKANNNLIFAKKNNLISEIPLDELIKKSKRVISTISSVLLECEMYSKKTCVYDCENFKHLMNELPSKATFNDYSSLCAFFRDGKNAHKLTTNSLNKYDNVRFLQCVEENYNEPSFSKNTLYYINNTVRFLLTKN